MEQGFQIKVAAKEDYIRVSWGDEFREDFHVKPDPPPMPPDPERCPKKYKEETLWDVLKLLSLGFLKFFGWKEKIK